MKLEGRGALIQRLAAVLLYTNRCRYRPTARTIARGLGISERSARRYLADLTAAGWPMPPARPEFARQIND